MIARHALLADLQKLLVRLEADLLERSESTEVPQVGQTLRADYEQAKAAARTAQNYEDWRSDAVTQAAAAWVLSCVFVRFLEDNRLIEPAKIAGPGERLRQARDEWELYLAKTSAPNERDYLLSVFDALAALPGTKDVFGPHNPIRELPAWFSGDAARDLLNFFQKINADTGLLIHDFTDPDWDTRFLGDLYQDLSEAARKKYALLQTPDFVEAFILDRTLEPALDEFGLTPPPVVDRVGDMIAPVGFRMIDPACGSGHFLLGGFRRILDRWHRNEPGTKTRELVQRSLDSVFGVDVNPFAVGIARFRLLLAAMRASDITRLADAPAFQLNLACGDSLLHGPGSAVQTTLGDIAEVHHAYQPEDLPLLRKYLTPGIYHAVVANPPYIVPRDSALNDAYRRRYQSCHRQYSLAVPFLERIFRLALSPSEPRTSASGAAGYTGQITANSFMKREFGKKLIEWFLPQIDLTHVIDTAGAYIPGHGTPTVILFGRNRAPLAPTLRTVMGIRGEPSTPDDAAKGLVWTSITTQIDKVGSQSEFVSVADSPRDSFHKHPWSIGGGGAAELFEQLSHASREKLSQAIAEIGRTTVAGDDDAWIVDNSATARRLKIRLSCFDLVVGDQVRDWDIFATNPIVYPYSTLGGELLESLPANVFRFLWPNRTVLSNRTMFGRTVSEATGHWHAHLEHYPGRLKIPLSITYADIATHNHFAFDRGGKVFNRTAPVIKLPADTAEDDHLSLLGLLNSSTACFWMKQVCHNKGSTVDQHGARQRTDPFEDFYAFNATKLLQLPIPTECPKSLAFYLDARVRKIADNLLPSALLKKGHRDRDSFEAEHQLLIEYQRQLISDQEELDWECYRLYGLDSVTLDSISAPPIQLGERAFEIVLARKAAAGEIKTTWFARHGSTPVTELPKHWPNEYKKLVERRIALIESNPNIRLIEQPEYKRRWNTESWESQLERALREWLLDRLESYSDIDGRMNDDGKPTAKLEIGLVSVAQLADVARRDLDFMQVGELYRDDAAFDVVKLVAELVDAESVPLLPVLRYKESGLRKRRQEWEKTWDLQRQQDDLARQRRAADDRIEQERQRVRESFQSQFSVIEDLAKQLRADCMAVRDRYAPSVTFEPDWDANMMARWLGDRGVDAAGGLALQALYDLRERLNKAIAELDSACHAKCRTDMGYQAAVKAREAIPADPEIDVPPKYASADFLKSDFWRLRGKLDVPKERWVSFPHCEGLDGSLMIAWAGYDHLQLARAVSAHYMDVQEKLGGRDDPRLIPLLGCLIELLPWIKQWHNDPDAAFDGTRMGDYFEGFINEEARQLGKTIDEIKAWTPPQRAATRGRRRAST